MDKIFLLSGWDVAVVFILGSLAGVGFSRVISLACQVAARRRNAARLIRYREIGKIVGGTRL